jgi:acylphosphatase
VLTDPASLSALVRGRVQGVSFRYFAQTEAARLHLAGWVRNLPDGEAVEVRAEGERKDLESFLELLKEGPQAAEVDDVKVRWGDYSGEFSDFRIKF